MSRTFKKFPYGCFRRVKGYHRVCQQDFKEDGVPEIRRGAIPPDPFDDVAIDNAAFLPQKIFNQMIDDGWDEEESIKKVAKKFHLSYHQASEYLKWRRRL